MSREQDFARMQAAIKLFEARKEAIMKERKVDRLTYEEIAKECGLGKTTVSLYFRGQVLDSSFQSVVTFLNWIGISPNDLARELDLIPV